MHTNVQFRKRKKWIDLIKEALMNKYDYSSVMQISRLEKIVINSGVGDATKDAKMIESVKNEKAITGQKVLLTKSKNQFLLLNYVKTKILVLKLH
jgi:large subunit ribosomal protein L5